MLSHDFKLQWSKQYLLLMSITFVASLIIIVSVPILWILQILLFLLLILYLGHITWRYILLRSPDSIIQLKFYRGKWQIQTHAGIDEAVLDGQSTVTRWISILRFRTSKKLFSCVIFRDSLLANNYRQLLVVLRCFR